MQGLWKPGKANGNSLKLDYGYVYIYKKVEYKDSIAIYCTAIADFSSLIYFSQF